MLDEYMRQNGVKPIRDEHGQMGYRKEDVAKITAGEIAFDKSNIKNRIRSVNKIIEQAQKDTDQTLEHFDKTLTRLVSMTNTCKVQAKSVSGGVRDSVNKLSNGLAKIEELANFDKLEGIVCQLERMEKSLSALAELDKSGSLDRVVKALSQK